MDDVRGGRVVRGGGQGVGEEVWPNPRAPHYQCQCHFRQIIPGKARFPGFFLSNRGRIRNHPGMRDACEIMTKAWIPRFAPGVWDLAGAGRMVAVERGGRHSGGGFGDMGGRDSAAAAGRRLSLLRVARYAAGFVWQSVVAGVDVAWRVFQPRMSLCPGIVRVAPRLPAGPARLLFRGLASLQPGSLACGVDRGGLSVVSLPGHARGCGGRAFADAG